MKGMFTLILVLAALGTFAQEPTAYQLQRKKINGLLDARSAKYGEFEESLHKHTGIFGLKTKKDMQRSIDILSEISATDNNIFRETKILLDFKDFEKTEVQTKVDDSAQRIKGYMNAITILQKQNDTLNGEIKQLEEQKNKYIIAIFCLIGMALLLFYWARKKVS